MSDLRVMFAHLSLFDDGSLLAELQVKSGSTSDIGLNNNGVLCFRGQDRLKVASNRQKSYADLKKRNIEYSASDFKFLKVSPWKKVLWFRCKGKLSPRFIGPYQILKHLGPVTYQLELPLKLDHIHDAFHVSILRRYQSDPSHVVSIEEIEVRSNLTYEEESIQILDRDIKILRRKSIPLVKVLWQNHGAEEATWELENSIRHQYPHLFRLGKFRGRIFF
ncbi:uncharacterized protein LOC108464894 [Gossypium arboreum]|uniref:uncharacterized protein LOC108464894 n=1 Tax=Gossypium arboreum TaxID=29729 RepID=UPI000818F33A|nr:uncharacterized protein LOC108464894 [Gossypium arboreum]